MKNQIVSVHSIAVLAVLTICMFGASDTFCQVSVSAAPAVAPIGTPATITISNAGTTPCTLTVVNVKRPNGTNDIYHGLTIIIPVGGATNLEYPEAWIRGCCPGANVNAVGTYIVSVDAACSPSQDFQTTFERTPGTIPTLTEWGAILFTLLLLGWMAWVLVRRRKSIVGEF